MQVALGGAQLRLEVTDASHVGAVRRAAQRLAEAWRFDPTSVGRVGLVATELATNLIRHGHGGELLIQPIHCDNPVQIELLAVDRGPGMITVKDCMRDGYSTCGTSGTGLGAVNRMSAVFDIYSKPRAGSIVLARVAASSCERRAEPASTSKGTQFGMISVAMHGEVECGDTWSIAQQGPHCSVLLVDGLGHGPLAAAAAGEAAKAHAEQPFEQPQETMRALHRRLNGSRGAAAACALFDEQTSTAHYAGVGNIATCIVSGSTRKGLLSHNGTLGLVLARAQALRYDWPPRSLTVMHSDGLTSRWSLEDYPGLAECHPAVIAAALMRDFSRGRDDSTVVVIRRLQ
jgi:anti-sigma regulatory factor (Ser/Thr protein kinase)